MKRNVGFIIGIILLMAFVWVLTIMGRKLIPTQESPSFCLPTLAIERILC